MFLSRSGLELNEIWAQQQHLMESDERLQRLRRKVQSDPSKREHLVRALRRAGLHDEADHHEMALHVHAYQQAHSKLTQHGRNELEKGRLSPKEEEDRIYATIDRERHLRQAAAMARKYVKARAAREGRQPEHHEIGEHIAKHLSREHAPDNHALTSQVIDVHHPYATRAGAYGRNVDDHVFLHDARLHKHKNPTELGGDDAGRSERHRWSHERHNRETSEDKSKHGHHPAIESIKKHLSRLGAGSVTYHTARVRPGPWRHERAWHHFEVTPAEKGERVNHVKPTVHPHNYDDDD